MRADDALAALKVAEYNQCGCLGTTLAEANADLEAALTTGYLVIRPDRDRPWTVGDQIQVLGPLAIEPACADSEDRLY